MNKNLLDQDNERRASYLNNIGVFRADLGNRKKHSLIWKNPLKWQRWVFEEDHYTIKTALGNLGYAFLILEMFMDYLDHLSKALEMNILQPLEIVDIIVLLRELLPFIKYMN